jgi:hypothetical protein
MNDSPRPGADNPVPAPDDSGAAATHTEATSGDTAPAAASPADERFRSCRWHTKPDGGGVSYCAHRDVQPFAGTSGFNPEAWCPDCKFFKVRRALRKRPASDWQG